MANGIRMGNFAGLATRGQALLWGASVLMGLGMAGGCRGDAPNAVSVGSEAAPTEYADQANRVGVAVSGTPTAPEGRTVAAPAGEATQLAYQGRADGSETPKGASNNGGQAIGAPDSKSQVAKKGEGEGDDEEPTDYWAKIPFDRDNFEEVQAFVRERYIDPNINDARAYAEAAGFALASDPDHGFLLMPEAFYKARKGHKEEEGGLDGAVQKLRKTDRFVILDVVKMTDEEREKARKRPRLSNDEIRDLRAKDRERKALLASAWSEIGFKASDFERVMDFMSARKERGEKWTVGKSWVSAAQGYLYALDPHSSLIAKAAWEESTRDVTDSSFEGIGAILTRRPDSEYTIVESPIEGQPAVKAGLRAGDMILKVDGKDIRGELLPKVVKRIRGPKDSKVVLTVEREGEPDALDIGIIRSRIAITNVQGKLVSAHERIGHVKVAGFVPDTERHLVAEVKRLEEEAGGPLRGLVLDLRNNSGGLLREGIRLADRFLKKGIIVSVRSRDGEEEVHRATSRGTWELPLVVLVSSGSASASEILASALQDNKRGLVFGDRTFGKASVQTLFTPPRRNDYYIKLTVARFYGPSGRTLQVLGVTPDVTVPPEFDGKMPIGFREENLSRHLSQLDKATVSPNSDRVASVAKCVKANGTTRRLHDADPNPAVKFDNQLMVAADHLECEIAETP